MEIGYVHLNKSGRSVGSQGPVEDGMQRRAGPMDMGFAEQGPLDSDTVDESFTQAPIDVREVNQVLVHRHFGHPEEHPVALRHRKSSADPLHGEEDKLVDEWKDLWDRAKRGQCTPMEMKRLHEIRGRLMEISSGREEDARRILGDDLIEKPSDEIVERAGRVPMGPTLRGRTFKARLKKGHDNDDDYSSEGKEALDESITWSRDPLDAAIILSGSILRALGAEPLYPADEPEDFGSHGGMPVSTAGETSGRKGSKNTGPYAGDLASGEAVKKARPKGWNKKSSKKFWEKVSKGPHTECVKHVGGTVDDPHAFCAWAEHEATGSWPAERQTKEKAVIENDRKYLRPGERPPTGANVQRGPKGGHFYDSDGEDADAEYAQRMQGTDEGQPSGLVHPEPKSSRGAGGGQSRPLDERLRGINERYGKPPAQSEAEKRAEPAFKEAAHRLMDVIGPAVEDRGVARRAFKRWMDTPGGAGARTSVALHEALYGKYDSKQPSVNEKLFDTWWRMSNPDFKGSNFKHENPLHYTKLDDEKLKQPSSADVHPGASVRQGPLTS